MQKQWAVELRAGFDSQELWFTGPMVCESPLQFLYGGVNLRSNYLEVFIVMGVPQMEDLQRKILLKWMIWGYRILGNLHIYSLYARSKFQSIPTPNTTKWIVHKPVWVWMCFSCMIPSKNGDWQISSGKSTISIPSKMFLQYGKRFFFKAMLDTCRG